MLPDGLGPSLLAGDGSGEELFVRQRPGPLRVVLGIGGQKRLPASLSLCLRRPVYPRRCVGFCMLYLLACFVGLFPSTHYLNQIYLRRHCLRYLQSL
jgi:hypothetical protein